MSRTKPHMLSIAPNARHEPESAVSRNTRAIEPGKRLLVKSSGRYVIIRTAQVRWIEAAANYVLFHTDRGKHVVRSTLSDLESSLNHRDFFRTSRSALVNLDYIEFIQTQKSGKHVIVLKDGTGIPLATGLNELRARL